MPSRDKMGCKWERSFQEAHNAGVRETGRKGKTNPTKLGDIMARMLNFPLRVGS